MGSSTSKPSFPPNSKHPSQHHSSSNLNTSNDSTTATGRTSGNGSRFFTNQHSREGGHNNNNTRRKTNELNSRMHFSLLKPKGLQPEFNDGIEDIDEPANTTAISTTHSSQNQRPHNVSNWRKKENVGKDDSFCDFTNSREEELRGRSSRKGRASKGGADQDEACSAAAPASKDDFRLGISNLLTQLRAELRAQLKEQLKTRTNTAPATNPTPPALGNPDDVFTYTGNQLDSQVHDYLASFSGDDLLRLALESDPSNLSENGEHSASKLKSTPAINTALPNGQPNKSAEAALDGEACTPAIMLMMSYLPKHAATPGSQEQAWLDAVKTNNIHRAQELFERGISPLTCDGVGLAALDYVCILDHPKIMPFLIEAIGQYLTRRLVDSIVTGIMSFISDTDISMLMQLQFDCNGETSVSMMTHVTERNNTINDSMMSTMSAMTIMPTMMSAHTTQPPSDTTCGMINSQVQTTQSNRAKIREVVERVVHSHMHLRLCVQQLQLAMRVTHPHVLLPSLQQNLEELDLHSVLMHIHSHAKKRDNRSFMKGNNTQLASPSSISSLSSSSLEIKEKTYGENDGFTSLSLLIAPDHGEDMLEPLTPSGFVGGSDHRPLSASPFTSMFHTPDTAAAASAFEQPPSLLRCASKAQVQFQSNFLHSGPRTTDSFGDQMDQPNSHLHSETIPAGHFETLNQDEHAIVNSSKNAISSSIYLPTAPLHPQGQPFVPPPALVRAMSNLMNPQVSPGSQAVALPEDKLLKSIMPDDRLKPCSMQQYDEVDQIAYQITSPLSISQSVLFNLPFSMMKQAFAETLHLRRKASLVDNLPATQGRLQHDHETHNAEDSLMSISSDLNSPTTVLANLGASLRSPPPLFSYYAQPMKIRKTTPHQQQQQQIQQVPAPQPVLFSDTDIAPSIALSGEKSLSSPRSAAFCAAYPYGTPDTRGIHLELLAAYLNLARYKHWTALTLTACCGGLEVTRILLSTGVMNVEKLGGCGYSALCCAIKCAVRAEKAIAQIMPPPTPAPPPPPPLTPPANMRDNNNGGDGEDDDGGMEIMRAQCSPHSAAREAAARARITSLDEDAEHQEDDGQRHNEGGHAQRPMANGQNAERQPPLPYSPKLTPEDPNMVTRRRAWGVVSLLLQYGARPKVLKKFLPLGKMGRAAVQEGLTQRLLPLCDLIVELIIAGDADQNERPPNLEGFDKRIDDDDSVERSDIKRGSIKYPLVSHYGNDSESPTSSSCTSAHSEVTSSMVNTTCSFSIEASHIMTGCPTFTGVTATGLLSPIRGDPGEMMLANSFRDSSHIGSSQHSSKEVIRPYHFPRSLLELIAEFAVVPHIDDVNFTTGKLYSEGSLEDLDDDHDTPALFKSLLPCNPTCTCHCHCRFCSDP